MSYVQFPTKMLSEIITTGFANSFSNSFSIFKNWLNFNQLVVQMLF